MLRGHHRGTQQLPRESSAMKPTNIVLGETVTVKGLFDLLSELAGLKAPTIKLPVPVLRALALDASLQNAY